MSRGLFTLAAFVFAYDLWAEETISSECARVVRLHPGYSAATLAYLALHLTDLLPGHVDPLEIFFTRLPRPWRKA